MAAQNAYWTACSVVLLAYSIPNATSVNVRMGIDEMAKKQFQSVLIFGSSVDRYALSTNYPHQTYAFKSERYQHSVVEDKQGRHLGMAV